MAYNIPVEDRLPPPIPDADDGDYAQVVHENQQVAAINAGGTIKFSDINFDGSNLNSLATRLHNQLQGIQGGAPNEYYHLTAGQYTALTGTITNNNISLTITGSGSLVAGVGAATVVRVSVGLYTVTLAAAKSNANYNVQTTVNNSAFLITTVINPTTTSFQVSVATLSGTATDPTRLYVFIS